MIYAKVVLSKLAVEGPFDYFVPKEIEKKIKAGCRVWVSFREKRRLGYVVDITTTSNIKRIKPIEELIDNIPILNKNLLRFTKDLSNYYCCAWSEMIETAIPQVLRMGKITNLEVKGEGLGYSTDALKKAKGEIKNKKNKSKLRLIWDLEGNKRWDIYFKEIEEFLSFNKGIIFLVSEVSLIEKAKNRLKVRFKEDITELHRQQSLKKELEQWLMIKKGDSRIVVATRCGIFAPLVNLGLVILDDEDSPSYKQDQTPHYHARQVAIMRADLEKAYVILGAQTPSLEAYYLTYRRKTGQIILNNDRQKASVKIVDLRQEGYFKRKGKPILSMVLENKIQQTLESKGRVLLFLNRRGFATNIRCKSCGFTLTCERCNVALVYHFSEKKLICHYCNYKTSAPQICPKCEGGYMSFFGLGTEKLESELHRLFPQARIGRLEKGVETISLDNLQLFIATQAILKEQLNLTFDLVGIVDVDISLNRIDFRAAENTFSLVYRLLNLADKEIIIQTHFSRGHYCLSLLNKDGPYSFYDYELKLRRKVGFPPVKHFVKVNLRGSKEERVKDASMSLFEGLKEGFKNKKIDIFSPSPEIPSKKRGKFYWQILLKVREIEGVSKSLKKIIDNFKHSSVIVTVDVDPL